MQNKNLSFAVCCSTMILFAFLVKWGNPLAIVVTRTFKPLYRLVFTVLYLKFLTKLGKIYDYCNKNRQKIMFTHYLAYLTRNYMPDDTIDARLHKRASS